MHDRYPAFFTTLNGDHSPQAHFRLVLYRLIERILHNIYRNVPEDTLSNLRASFPFLETFRDQITALPFESLITEFEMDYADHLPLRALSDELGLGDDELLVLLAAGIVEDDLRFGALFAALQHPLDTRRPCLGLLGWLLAKADTQSMDAWAAVNTLARHGLITIQRDDTLMHLEWTVRVPLPIWAALRGDVLEYPAEHIQRQYAADFPPLDDLVLPRDLHDQLSHLRGMVRDQTLDTLVVRGMTGSGRRTTVGAVARTVGRDVLLAEQLTEDVQKLLGPLATLTRAVPLVQLQANPGETITLDRLPGYAGVVGISMGRTGGVDGSAMENALTLTLPPPDPSGRAQFWYQTGGELDPSDADAIIDQVLLTGGRIHHVAQLAQNHMQLAGRDAITLRDIQIAMRAMNRQALETLATPLSSVDGWSKLVVHPHIAEELHMLEARCRRRESLMQHVGDAFENNLNRGVRALFNGPSGTGKTYAVRALAGALKMDLYRVDLASIVNKYIGETEKNLNRVFTYAEELDVLLLLDEGDSLMTRRTDVRGANDRYANLETNFLLQRLENYEGIIVVTSNASQRIDQAFIRRLDVVIEFAVPGTDERRWLWLAHLPEIHTITHGFLDRVIQRCELTGGQIRNVALYASLLGMVNGATIGNAEFEAALQREYHHASLPYPLAG